MRLWNDVRTETEIRQNMYRELENPSSESNRVSYYKFNEGDGTTTAVDSKGGRDGTLTNMTGDEWETSPAMFGPKNTLNFDGVNETVSVLASASLNLNNSSFTIEFWANGEYNGPDENLFVESGAGWTTGTYQITCTNGDSFKVNFNGSSSGGCPANNTWGDNQRHHITGSSSWPTDITGSSSWPTASNWSRESVPGASDNVGIYTYTGGTIAAVSGSPTVNHLLLGSSSSMTLSSGLTVNGNLILESNLDLNGQTVTLGSSGYLIEDAGLLNG